MPRGKFNPPPRNGGVWGTRKFLRLEEFLKATSVKAEENAPNPKVFP
jgi:hypothetical protein